MEAVKRLAPGRELVGWFGQAEFESVAAVYDCDRLAEKYAETIGRFAAAENSRGRG